MIPDPGLIDSDSDSTPGDSDLIYRSVTGHPSFIHSVNSLVITESLCSVA